MTAARFIRVPCIGSYILDTTRMNIKNVSTSSLPLHSSTEPTSATVPMPKRRIHEADTTNTAVPSSALKLSFSRAVILPFKPSR